LFFYNDIAKPGVMPTLKRSEILQAGVSHMAKECDALKTTLSTDDSDADDDAKSRKATLIKRIDLLTQSIAKDQDSLASSIRVEAKRETTPKRRRMEVASMPEDLDLDKQVDESKVSHNHCVENQNTNVLKNDGAQVFSEVIQSMSHSVDTFVRVGKVPRQIRDGTSQVNSKPFAFIKVEVSQPAAKNRMHLIAWGSLANSMQQQLLGLEDSVVRIRHAKYDYAKKFEEHQIKLHEKTTFEKVCDKNILEAFDSNGLPETSISKIGECRALSRINVKGYVRSCDESPNGPSTNASYWRNFDLSDATGCLVKGMAWGSSATIAWIPNVTVEMFNVSVRKTDERIQVDESSVIIFKDQYDLGLTMPAFFKSVVWQP
jgi:hypothetical protein